MKKQTIETATFGGRLCVRSGWFWIGATLADLEAMELQRTAKGDRIGWALSVGLILLAFLAVLVKETLA